MTAAFPIEADAVVIGAGPVGLFQVFELGLLEIKAHVIDSLPHAGGQCVELYADKPIYDIPSVKLCTGRELVDNLLKQVEPFQPVFHLGQVVTGLQRRADGRFDVETSRGTRFLARTIFIAAGVGAFLPRALKVEGIERFAGSQVHHFADDASRFAGKHVVIVGGDEIAVQRAIEFATEGPHRAASVTLLHRREVLQADAQSLAKLQALCDAQQMRFVVGQVTGLEESAGRLAAVKVAGPDGTEQSLALDTLLVLLGISPKLGPVAEWGLDLERKQLKVDTEMFATSEPGIFAVGDINTYPGKKKLILCGFHEATLAAFGAAPIVFPDRKVMLQYTTTSPRLHALLRPE
jgi:thioredoxin reductase (NADPH)